MDIINFSDFIILVDAVILIFDLFPLYRLDGLHQYKPTKDCLAVKGGLDGLHIYNPPKIVQL